jgi:hypothetical protein
MYRKRLAENFVQIALLVFEIRIFEVDCPVGLNFFFWPIHKYTDGQTDRHGETDGQAAVKQAMRQTDTQTERQTGRQAEGHLDRQTLTY